MENNQNQPAAAPVPEIPKEELKMPEEKVSSPVATTTPKGPISPLLVIVLVFSLILLGVVIFWGNKIVEIFMPLEEPTPITTPTETDTATTSTPTPMTVEEEIADIEKEASSTEAELNATETELNAIEAEINAELQ